MPRFFARSCPTASMSGLMSLTVTAAPLAAMRKAMSPVPPAMSRIASPLRGFTRRTNWSFQRRCKATRHGVVHQVVAARDAGKDAADQPRLLLRIDLAIAEGNCLAHEGGSSESSRRSKGSCRGAAPSPTSASGHIQTGPFPGAGRGTASAQSADTRFRTRTCRRSGPRPAPGNSLWMDPLRPSQPARCSACPYA